MYNLVHPLDLQYFSRAHEQLIKTGSSGMVVYRVVSKNMKVLWMQTNCKLLYRSSKPETIEAFNRLLTEDEGLNLLSKRNQQFTLPYSQSNQIFNDLRTHEPTFQQSVDKFETFHNQMISMDIPRLKAVNVEEHPQPTSRTDHHHTSSVKNIYYAVNEYDYTYQYGDASQHELTNRLICEVGAAHRKPSFDCNIQQSVVNNGYDYMNVSNLKNNNSNNSLSNANVLSNITNNNIVNNNVMNNNITTNIIINNNNNNSMNTNSNIGANNNVIRNNQISDLNISTNNNNTNNNLMKSNNTNNNRSINNNVPINNSSYAIIDKLAKNAFAALTTPQTTTTTNNIVLYDNWINNTNITLTNNNFNPANVNLFSSSSNNNNNTTLTNTTYAGQHVLQCPKNNINNSSKNINNNNNSSNITTRNNISSNNIITTTICNKDNSSQQIQTRGSVIKVKSIRSNNK
ncbi:hypothetical protein HELRODRAFT_161383 [Helobdella robusta]|uniref:Uncharacterized protein n=1 Tax=Helobdella robusta TaxID=6412 RepID=T1ERF1_HELRO|nr:hypothetical protein HELRODRAFT_161383 [Helobdella robusta]ESO02146.1 hypothetical protein HELRODRAFT_161383 [Helobdella robusta]